MAKGNVAQPDYQTLKTELDELMIELQRDDLDVDLALKHYKRGLELTRQLETYLKTAENEVRELRATLTHKPKA
ncbi:MAG: exodeoxyribonuclease VII small subunit [Candidatus Saccharimonadales bacterium]